jgi:propanol-preferring alcohol dehydrogenase
MVDVPKVCRAAPATNAGTMEYTISCREDYPVPEPKEGELLVKLNFCGVCQSDHRECLVRCGDRCGDAG